MSIRRGSGMPGCATPSDDPVVRIRVSRKDDCPDGKWIRRRHGSFMYIYQSILSWEASHERVLFCTEAGCFSSPVLINALLAAEEPLLWINKREIG